MPPFAVDGDVRDELGKPIPGARVDIISSFNERLWVVTATDKAGKYSASIANPGQYRVIASSPRFIRAGVAVVLPAKLPRPRRTVRLTLDRASIR